MIVVDTAVQNASLSQRSHSSCQISLVISTGKHARHNTQRWCLCLDVPHCCLSLWYSLRRRPTMATCTCSTAWSTTT